VADLIKKANELGFEVFLWPDEVIHVKCQVGEGISSWYFQRIKEFDCFLDGFLFATRLLEAKKK